jgi:hypothetical protein
MKECPVCKEAFQDDLNFCDLDGSPLEGGAGTVASSSSKLWSFLGIALLLAAVGITAGAIIFFPRGPSATLSNGRSQSGTTAASSTQPSTTATDSGRAQTGGSLGLDQSTSKSGIGDATTSASPDQARLASRKAALSKNDNSDISLPNPKSVVSSDDDLTTAAARSADETRPRISSPTSGVESGQGAKVVSSGSTGSDSAAKAQPGSASAKRRSKTQAQGDDGSATGSKKDDKKKGGFLRVFKKIFGHG